VCWDGGSCRNGFVLMDGDGHALVTVDDRANEVRICSRHQRRPSTLAEKVCVHTCACVCAHTCVCMQECFIDGRAWDGRAICSYGCRCAQLSLVTVMLVRRKYSGAHILFEVRRLGAPSKS
jgi:hypothetical protein